MTRDWNRRIAADSQRRAALVRSSEWSFPCDQLVQDDAERKQIGPGIGGLAEDLFGRHVDRARIARGGVQELRRRGHALVHGHHEIGNFDLTAPRDENVPRFDVAVDDALRVGVSQGPRHVRGDRKRRRQRQAADLLPDVLERETIDVFEHQPHTLAATREVVDLDDIRVVELREQPGLAFEGRRKGRRRQNARAERLDENRAPERLLDRVVEVVYGAGMQLPQHLATGELGQLRHVWR
jgi:hypothetical protein